MELVKCKGCGSVNRAELRRCPACTLGIFKPVLWWIPMGAICALLVFAFVRTDNPEDRSEAKDRAAIDACRMQDKIDAEDGTVDCEKLIARFVEKYGAHPY